MSRIEGLPANKAGLYARIAYWLTRRKTGRMLEPVAVTAHHPRLLRAMGAMEMGQAAAKSVDPALKALAEVKVAMRVGCPF